LLSKLPETLGKQRSEDLGVMLPLLGLELWQHLPEFGDCILVSLPKRRGGCGIA